MKDDDVVALLTQVKSTPSEDLESDCVEFKGYRDEAALNNDKGLPMEVSALANRMGGGVIIVGVKDDSDVHQGRWEDQLAGVPPMDCTLVQERLRGRVDPAIPLTVREVSFEGRAYVVIGVPHRSDTLVATRGGKYAVRDGRSSRPMTPPEVQAAVRALSNYDWSGEELAGDPAKMLDPVTVAEAVADFSALRKLESVPTDEEYLEAVGATRGGRLTHGGLLFLGSEAAIRTSLGDHEYRFTWKTDAGELKQNDVWAGNLWQAIKRAKEYFGACNQERSGTYQGKNFIVPLLDPVAFHEGYLNALTHRDYASPGMVSITFGGGYLTITSPGGFYGGVTAENIVRHEPRHRNQALARIFMVHNFVDRAGMGVFRMGIRSLRYGRAFPKFCEVEGTVEVQMQGEYMRPAIAVLTLDSEADSDQPDFGIPELLILNSVYGRGYCSVREIEGQLSRLAGDSWEATKRAVENLREVELCGTRDGVFIRVRPAWKNFFKVTKILRLTGASAKYVRLYDYLKRHGKAQNADIRSHLSQSHASSTSAFLRGAKFVRRTGKGPGARWHLDSSGCS